MNMMRFFIRVMMVAGVVAAIFGFLYFPIVVTKYKDKDSINVLAWPTALDTEYLENFEKETGIKIFLTYFENYEELLVKMRGGGGDYDLVMVSGYAANMLIHNDLAKPIDKAQLSFWSQLYPVLLGHYYDPENMYAIPFAWEAYGIGIDKRQFDGDIPEASWSLLFDETKAPEWVGMLDDAREVVSIAALYLYGLYHPRELTLQQVDEIKALLVKQKKWVATYTDLRTSYLLLSQAVPVVVGVSSDIYQAKREHDNIEFLVPKEGSFIVIDNFLLPANTTKDAQVYALLNYLYRPEVAQKYADRYNFFSAMKGVTSDADRFMITPVPSLFSRLRFFNYIIPEQQMRELWIALKS